MKKFMILWELISKMDGKSLIQVLIGFVLGALSGPYIQQKIKPSENIVEKSPLVVPKLPSINELSNSFDINEKRVVSNLLTTQPVIKSGDKTYPWTFTKNIKLEIINKKDISNSSIELTVKLEDVNYYGVFNRKIDKIKGIVKIKYDSVMGKDSKRVWFLDNSQKLIINPEL